ncbi:probable 1,4-Benzoquinone reductase [Sporisorium scitamineum]|nr:probable 1,4-Benzoquinone reductase [Sporisorium scitamineum]
MSKIAIIVYSTYGHVATLTKAVEEGAKSTGADITVFQIPETLSEEVLGKLHANKAAIADYPVITPDKLKEFDGFIFGFPTRYGRAPAQVSAFFDQTGGLWASGALIGKFGSIFTSTASQHGGNETTHLTTIPFFVHHGINFVPHGYRSFADQANLEQIHGASPYGAGTIAGGDGSRQPIDLDLQIAKAQGEHFANVVNTFVKGKST